MAKIDHVAEAVDALREADELPWEQHERGSCLVAYATAHALLAVVEQLTTIANSR